jgi:hypothetical protein
MLYESRNDRANEARIAERVEKAWGVRMSTAARLCPYDYTVWRDSRQVALAEIKCRTQPFGSYRYFLVNEHKWSAIRADARALNIAAVLIGAFPGRLMWLDLLATEVHHAGMSERRDGLERGPQPVIYYEWHKFHTLRERETP